ncbi:hypothetical protein [Streptodolium elevatio]
MASFLSPLLTRLTSLFTACRQRGRHRAGQPPVLTPDAPQTIPSVDQPTVELRPESPTLVRPYIRAHEQRVNEHRAQRQRRIALWLAVHGVDAGPRSIHGSAVPR